MHAPLQLGLKYIHYILTAANGKGHGVHSPFVFNFIQQVLNDNTHYPAYSNIEQLRNELLKNRNTLTIQDFGAGSMVIKSNKRIVKDVARSSLKPKKYSQLLYRLVRYYKPASIIELGTSLGVTTAYLASGSETATVYTHEGANEIAGIASQNFSALSLPNIQVTLGNFDDTLGKTLQHLSKVDLAFLDGNHRKIPTLQYFEQLLATHHDQSIFVIDDIYWSREMEEAWQQIKNHPAVTLSIDLFFIGIVFFRKEQREPEHFKIRF